MKKEPAFMAGSYVNECFQLCMLLFSFVAFTHQPRMQLSEVGAPILFLFWLRRSRSVIL